MTKVGMVLLRALRAEGEEDKQRRQEEDGDGDRGIQVGLGAAERGREDTVVCGRERQDHREGTHHLRASQSRFGLPQAVDARQVPQLRGGHPLQLGKPPHFPPEFSDVLRPEAGDDGRPAESVDEAPPYHLLHPFLRIE